MGKKHKRLRWMGLLDYAPTATNTPRHAAQQSVFNAETASTNNNKSIKNTFTPKVTATITRDVYNRLVAAVQTMATERQEIGGQLKISYVDGQLKIKDYNLLKQTVSSVDFEINAEEVSKFALEHMDDEDFHEWRGWWHSHHNMGLFWSSTDDEQFKQLLEGRENYKDCFGIVFTADGNFRARYDVRTPYGILSHDDIIVEIETDEKATIKNVREEMATAAKTLCEKKIVTPITTPVSYAYNYGLYKYVDATSKVHHTAITKPFSLRELTAMANLHNKVFKGWTLGHECDYWGLDFEKIMQALEEDNQPKTLAPEGKYKRYDNDGLGCDACGKNKDLTSSSRLGTTMLLCEECLFDSGPEDWQEWETDMLRY